ncbi:hypothetical protein HHX47_DHR1001252 [Lentinula edodes]|nr:hypothetical protein HHX47_DHR1001252 [Lentinula edodes]
MVSSSMNVAGTNDNVGSGGTICAERTAIVKSAVGPSLLKSVRPTSDSSIQSEGKRSFAALAVVTDVKSAISPCGLCRQVIREFCAQDMPILLVPADYPQFNKDSGDAEKGVKQTSIGELLPDSFGPEHLELPRGTV